MLQGYKSFLLLTVTLLAGCGSEGSDSNSNKFSEPLKGEPSESGNTRLKEKEEEKLGQQRKVEAAKLRLAAELEKQRKEDVEKEQEAAELKKQLKEDVEKEQKAAELEKQHAKIKAYNQLEDMLLQENGSSMLSNHLTDCIRRFKVRGVPVFYVNKSNRKILINSLDTCLQSEEVLKSILDGNKNKVIDKLFDAIKPLDSRKIIHSFTSTDQFVHDSLTNKYSNPTGAEPLVPALLRFIRLEIGEDRFQIAQTAQGIITRFENKWQVNFYNGFFVEVPYSEWAIPLVSRSATSYSYLTNKQTGEKLYCTFMEPVRLFNEDGSLTSYGNALRYIFNKTLKEDDVLSKLWQGIAIARSAAQLSSEVPGDVSDQSLRNSRLSRNGGVDASALYVNNSLGQRIELDIPLFVQLKGNISNNKMTDAVNGSFTYRCGHTLFGVIQGYANSGKGFGAESRQLETSLIASQSFGTIFIEGQIGKVSISDVHLSDWSGYRSQLRLGMDTTFIAPFVQITCRQLTRDNSFNLSEITGHIGLDMGIANLQTDTYSMNTNLITKIGYDSKTFFRKELTLGITAQVLGFLEWSGSLNLNNGSSFNADLKLSSDEATLGIQASLTR